MLIKCSSCSSRISIKWLVLGLPWSTYTCAKCGAEHAGTLFRLFSVSIATGVLGYVVIGAVKGKINPLWIPLPLAVTLAVLFLALPMQLKRTQTNQDPTDTGSS